MKTKLHAWLTQRMTIKGQKPLSNWGHWSPRCQKTLGADSLAPTRGKNPGLTFQGVTVPPPPPLEIQKHGPEPRLFYSGGHNLDLRWNSYSRWYVVNILVKGFSCFYRPCGGDEVKSQKYFPDEMSYTWGIFV